MAVLLFRLNNVPEDEADEVRALLKGHAIPFYETPGGRWGISVAGIWLYDDLHLERARELIDGYQQERARKARDEYERRCREGDQETLWRRFRREPLLFIFFALFIAGILYISLVPFLGLGG
jgi:hypothetical protein